MACKRKKSALRNGADMRDINDPFGSYTGVASGDCYEDPIQDADDL